MKYFKNVELARIYNVSEKAVRNWVESAQNGKLNLELYEKDGRFLAANTVKNQLIIEELVKKGQKYKNTRAYKTVTPSQKFYELYNDTQILDIISGIDVHREIPLQYSYFNGGAEYWDKYAQRLLKEKTPNTLKSTIKLFELNEAYLSEVISKFKKVNVVDLGVGDCLPVKGLLEFLQEKSVLGRYVGIDISEDMFTIAKRNIDTWFTGKVAFENVVRDINYDRFEDLLAEELYGDDETQTINLVLLLGGTLSNMRVPEHVLRLINNSMGRNDVLFYSLKLDTENARRYFDFNVGSPQLLDTQTKFTLDLLNIEGSFYDVEQLYDERKRSRFIRIKLKMDLRIAFEVGGKSRHLSLKKNETVLWWRAKHYTALEVIDQFDKNGFDLLQATTTPDQEYLMTISKIKTGL